MLEVKAFSGLRARSGAEAGWSTGGTNAAFIISLLRYKHGEDFTYADLQDFKQQNGIPDWEPRDDLLADGVLVGEGDGVIYFPEGFDSTGWRDIYSTWKSGQSVANAPQLPAIIGTDFVAPQAPAETHPLDEIGYQSSSAAHAAATATPAPAVVPDLEVQPVYAETITDTQAASAQNYSQPFSASAAQVAAATQAQQPAGKSNMMPLLILGGGAVALALMFGGKKKGDR